MVRLAKYMVMLAFTVLAVGCMSIGEERFRDVEVTDVGSDGPTELCAGFRLSSDQALQFLNQSRRITTKQMHDHYNYLPRYVKGSVTRVGESQEVCNFTIRAGGTAELRCENGQSYIYGCDNCEELLTDPPNSSH